jgi:hypothetical protein
MLPKFVKMPKMPKLTKVYTINERGNEFCPKEETYIENLSDYDSPLCKILRFIRVTGPKGPTEKEIYSHFSPSYKDRQIENVLTTATYMGLVDIKRTIRFL